MALTQQGSKFYICATPQTADLADAAAYAALTFIEVGQVGAVGETGTVDNILSYDAMDTSVTQKAKGIADAGNPEIEVARDPSDTGQDAMRTAAALPTAHAFKREMNDSGGSTPTIIYMRGIIGGPKRPNGRNEDFDLEIFQLGLLQKEIVVDPT